VLVHRCTSLHLRGRVVRSVLPGLTRSNVGLEAMSGVTLVAIAVPLKIGYAQIAGLPPTAGLYALVVPSILYALTVSSRQVVAPRMRPRRPWSHPRSAVWPWQGVPTMSAWPWPRKSSAA
jgi:hypothetical protein